MHRPERTCVGCRARRPQDQLLRMRRRADGVIVPARAVVGGRSAYLCRARPCWERALSRRAIVRGFRGACSYDPTQLWTQLVGATQGGLGDE